MNRSWLLGYLAPYPDDTPTTKPYKLLDDGTLVVTVEDATIISRVLVEDSHNLGGLYYPDTDAEPKQGEWIESKEYETYIGADFDCDPIIPKKYKRPICSVCGEEFAIEAFKYKFCPNCGARMKGESDDS